MLRSPAFAVVGQVCAAGGGRPQVASGHAARLLAAHEPACAGGCGWRVAACSGGWAYAVLASSFSSQASTSAPLSRRAFALEHVVAAATEPFIDLGHSGEALGVERHGDSGAMVSARYWRGAQAWWRLPWHEARDHSPPWRLLKNAPRCRH